MKPIAIVIPYFGHFPKWMNFYLYTCSKQDLIDFHYFTDCDIPNKTYPNTIFHPISFKEYCELVSLKLDIKFTPLHPYFLCMCKPFIGLIHEDLLIDYKFWGYADIDLIYGNMQSFISKKNLLKYDVITTHVDRLAGHFTIYRNNVSYRNIAKKIHNWKNILEGNNFVALDESQEYMNLVVPNITIRDFANKILKRVFSNRDVMYRLNLASQLTQMFHPKVLLKEGYTSLIPINGIPWIYDLARGLVKPISRKPHNIPNKLEIPYLHFLFFKKTQYRESDTYWKDGFYELSNDIFDNQDKIVIDTNGIRTLKL